VAALRGGAALPAGAALLTFDDGYLDHFTQVLPLLAARGIQGSFFPPARAVVERRVLDVNKIHFVLASVEDVSELLPRVFTLLDELREEFGLESREAYFERFAVASRWDSREVKFVKNRTRPASPGSSTWTRISCAACVTTACTWAATVTITSTSRRFLRRSSARRWTARWRS
jgi:hypothetical protein